MANFGAASLVLAIAYIFYRDRLLVMSEKGFLTFSISPIEPAPFWNIKRGVLSSALHLITSSQSSSSFSSTKLGWQYSRKLCRHWKFLWDNVVLCQPHQSCGKLSILSGLSLIAAFVERSLVRWDCAAYWGSSLSITSYTTVLLLYRMYGCNALCTLHSPVYLVPQPQSTGTCWTAKPMQTPAM